jgi:hydroxymethylpyrimidine/phosphomethylpyrimidine kinase
MNKPVVCLAIGGSDSCGGAGIQADLAMFARIGVSGCTAITALTAQNPDRILRITPSSLDQFEAELQAILSYYTVAAIKTGMLADAAHIRVLTDAMERYGISCPVVVDPVMVSTSGTQLLDLDAMALLQSELFARASLITPNLPEAEQLIGSIFDDPVEAAAELVRRHRCAVLIKGGHGDGDTLVDVLCMADGDVHLFEHPRLHWDKDQAHGSGCRLAAAITGLLALHTPVAEAVSRAVSHVAQFHELARP